MFPANWNQIRKNWLHLMVLIGLSLTVGERDRCLKCAYLRQTAPVCFQTRLHRRMFSPRAKAEVRSHLERTLLTAHGWLRRSCCTWPIPRVRQGTSLENTLQWESDTPPHFAVCFIKAARCLWLRIRCPISIIFQMKRRFFSQAVSQQVR